MWTVIAIIIIVLSLALAAIILWRKIPELRMIDIESIPKEKTRKTKEQIILQRFDRIRSEKLGKVGRVAVGAAKGASKAGRRAVQRLYALEQYYQKLKQSADQGEHAIDQDTVKRLLDEADNLVRDEEFLKAEKRYIEVISHHPKNIDAYEGLGNLYLKNKQYDQARETFNFTLRINPEDASVNMSLAELEIALENFDEAVESARKAVDKRPGNPKYLDIYINVALAAKKRDDAWKGMELLKKANPENKKIEEFEERFRAMTGQ